MSITCIATFGSKKDREIESLLLKKLSPRYCLVNLNDKGIAQIGKGYDVLLYSSDKTKEIEVDSAIVILKEDCTFCPKIVSKNSVIIAFSENEKQISSLAKITQPTITCSGQKSTISFSSNSDDSAVITLNRAIKSLSGRIIEPLEFPISVDGKSSLYSLMALTAVQLTLDDFNSKLGKLF